MKKLIAILLTLVMLFALSATAMADMQTLSWITARRGIGMTDLTGKFYQIEDYDIDIWIPDNFELQEDIPDYCYCVFATEDGSASISVNNLTFDGEPALEDIEKDIIPNWGAASDGIFWINCFNALVYENADEDTISVLIKKSEGDAMEFEFKPASSPDMYSLTSLVMSTIQYHSLHIVDAAQMIDADLNNTWSGNKDVRYQDDADTKEIDVYFWEDGITSENIHDVTNWDEMKQNIVDNFAGVYEAAISEFGMTDVTLTVKYISSNLDEDLSFLTIQDGEVVYDVFEDEAAA